MGCVKIGKGVYLKRVTAAMKMQSVAVEKELNGSSPPSVFIGRWNYPKVYAGPMIAPFHGDTRVIDTPELWIPNHLTQEEIIANRLSLVRGKHQVDVKDLGKRYIEKLQEIALSNTSIESEVIFSSRPKGITFSDEFSPFGPSATIEEFDIGSVKWNRDLEKIYYDTDLKATDALNELHRKGVPFSSIQKAFSVGTIGTKKRRHLVPTRWSITACDSSIGASLLNEVRKFNIVDTLRVHEFQSLHNYYTVLLIPTAWQFEWMEAFLRILGTEEIVYSDYERYRGKNSYSPVGGCYYACKMAVLEALAHEKRQASAIILREAYRGYIPLGVFNVRENVRNAMLQQPLEFEDLKSALTYISTKLMFPIMRFIEKSNILKDLLNVEQTTLRGIFV